MGSKNRDHRELCKSGTEPEEQNHVFTTKWYTNIKTSLPPHTEQLYHQTKMTKYSVLDA